MLVLEIEFLTGRYAATAFDSREGHEWPPHPARLYSALVATWADSDDPSEEERRVLEWLENQGSPEVSAPEVSVRDVVTHYVPINDSTAVRRKPYKSRYDRIMEARSELAALGSSEAEVKKARRIERRIEKQRDVGSVVSTHSLNGATIQVLPDSRGKQAFWFPSVRPAQPRTVYIWPSAEPTSSQHRVLDDLLRRVVRLGHSSSLVSCRLLEERPDANLVPDDSGTQSLRVAGPGQLSALEDAHARHLAFVPRALPHIKVRYRPVVDRPAADTIHPEVAGQLITLQFDQGRRVLPLVRTLAVTRALRGAVLRYAEDPVPRVLSGHDPDGAPTSAPHVSFLALPFVGSRYATGNIMGVGLLLPTADQGEGETMVLRSLGRWFRAQDDIPRLTLGRAGVFKLIHDPFRSGLRSLQRSTWDRPSRRWITAVPLALPRHPGDLRRGSASARARAWERAREGVVTSCLHVGLPEPERVTVASQPLLLGTRPTHQFPPLQQGKAARRALVHADITFPEPISGPVVLGAGRYLGLGLCQPVREGPSAPLEVVPEEENRGTGDAHDG